MFDSPSPWRIRRGVASPSPTEYYSPRPSTPPAWSPMVRASAKITVANEFAKLWIDVIPKERIEAAAKHGSLFTYRWDAVKPGGKDKSALKEQFEVCMAQLTERPDGLFRKSVIQQALVLLQRHWDIAFNGRDTYRTQSANYIRYFTDIRNGKNQMTSGAKTDPWLLKLYKAMNPLGDYNLIR